MESGLSNDYTQSESDNHDFLCIYKKQFLRTLIDLDACRETSNNIIAWSE